MVRLQLDDRQWGKIEAVLAAERGVATLVRLRELARALGQVQHHRRRGSCELLRQMAAPARQPFDDFVREHQKIQGDGVDVETFMIEHHAGSSATPAERVVSPSRPQRESRLHVPVPVPVPVPDLPLSLQIGDRP